MPSIGLPSSRRSRKVRMLRMPLPGMVSPVDEVLHRVEALAGSDG